jgi:multidrug resistance efflux pump
MDRRKLWREQEQQVVERWHAAEARHREVQAEVSRHASSGNDGTSEELKRRVESARAEMEAVRRQVARLKVEFVSGKRY